MSSEAESKIDFEKDGAIAARNVPKMTNSRGDDVALPAKARLCRCGKSGMKPFCDNSHRTTGFTAAPAVDRVPDKPASFEGKNITIHDNRGICSHAGHCTARLAKVFTFPDIQPDAAKVQEIIETIDLCPSGALSYTLDGILHRDKDQEPKIHISRNGPYEVRGGIDVNAEMQGNASSEHYTLCRCGSSRNKPFCDGTHWYVDFRDDETRTKLGQGTKSKAEPEWHDIGTASDVPEGKARKVSAGGKELALFDADGVRALDNTCPHQGGPLAEGTVEDGCLRCPWHGWGFDKDGENVDGHEESVASYPVKEDGGKLQAEIPTPGLALPTVADVIANTMVDWDVRHVFGMVGHSNLGMADAIRRQVEKGRMEYIGIRHEGAAAFACSAYGKLTGKPAACLAIAGPGATNLLTGLWDAKVDRAPVLALTGQIDQQVLGTGAFQEIDLASAFAPVSAFSQTLLPDSDHGELVSLALKTAMIQGGVGHLILPNSVQEHEAPKDARIGSPDGRMAATDIPPTPTGIQDALYRFWRSKRPVIIVGYGALGHMDKILALAKRLMCPVLTTFKAMGALPDDHPQSAGVLGRSGTPVASHFMANADLLIVFGASFAQHTGIDGTKPTIQVDRDRMVLGKFHAVSSPIWGDIGASAEAMLDGLPDGPFEDQLQELKERRKKWGEEKASRRATKSDEGLHSAVIFETLSDLIPDDAVVPLDVGNNTYSFGRYFRCTKQRILMSGYLGSIGFALPAAMGAWAGADGRKVVSISGDGGFGQYMGEFTTLVKHEMDITHVLLNNGELGKISAEQRAGDWDVWETGLRNPNFAEYATLCGGLGIRVTKGSELVPALKKAIAHNGPALVEIITDASLV